MAPEPGIRKHPWSLNPVSAFPANVSRRTVREYWSPPFRADLRVSRAPGLRSASGVVDPEDTARRYQVEKTDYLRNYQARTVRNPLFPIGSCRHSLVVQLGETVGELSDLVESFLGRPLTL